MVQVETEDWNNDAFEAAPDDTEYNLTITKREIGFIGANIDQYIQMIVASVDRIVEDSDLFTKVCDEIEILLSLGGKLTEAVGIEYNGDVLGDLKMELEKIRSEIKEK